MATVESIKSRCEMVPWDGCWIWMGAHSRGYGFVGHEGKSFRTHRLMYKLVNGDIPNGMVVMHKCDHPGCVNPEHLYAGTQSDNIMDCSAKGRLNHNSLCGVDHCKAKLSEDGVRMVRRSDLSNYALARIFGVSRKTIEDVRKRKTWKHIA